MVLKPYPLTKRRLICSCRLAFGLISSNNAPNKVSPEFLKLQNAVTNIAGIEILEREGDRGPLEGYDL